MVEVLEYLDRRGHSLFATWSDSLHEKAAAKVAAALARMQQGNFSNAKCVGPGVYEYKIDFGPGLLDLLRQRWRTGCDPAWRRNEETPASGHYGSTCSVAGLQATKRNREVKLMALTRDFKETIQARVERDPGFRQALLREGIENFLSGDVDTGKIILRDFINATVGFAKLSDVTHRSPKSLMRMLAAWQSAGAQSV